MYLMYASLNTCVFKDYVCLISCCAKSNVCTFESGNSKNQTYLVKRSTFFDFSLHANNGFSFIILRDIHYRFTIGVGSVCLIFQFLCKH